MKFNSSLLLEILKFRDERDWKQFHTPKNLSAALAVESAELQECFLWQTDEEARGSLRKSNKKVKIVEELADIIIYSYLLADSLQVDIDTIVRDKLGKNAAKYPVEKAKGNHRKYSEFSE